MFFGCRNLSSGSPVGHAQLCGSLIDGTTFHDRLKESESPPAKNNAVVCFDPDFTLHPQIFLG